MRFEIVPLFENSIKILKFWSLILRHDWRRYACLVPSLIMNITQLIGIFANKSSLDECVQGGFFFILWFNGLIRMSSLLYHRYRYEKLMEDLSVVYKDIQANEGEELNRILEKTTKLAKNVETSNMSVGIVATIAMCLYPLFIDTRVHPFAMHFPGINKFESPWYEIIYIFQITTSPAGLSICIPFTSIIISFFMLGTLMCKVLHQHLRNLKRVKPEHVWTEILWCIRYHQQIIRYVDILNSLTTYIFFVEFLFYGALLCALMFLLVVVQSITKIIIMFTYIAAIFSHVAAMYWFSNEFSDHCTELAVAAYDTNWYEFDTKAQKALRLFIARAQKPCSILIGNVYPMSLETFQSLLNVTYSYFTILKRLYG